MDRRSTFQVLRADYGHVSVAARYNATVTLTLKVHVVWDLELEAELLSLSYRSLPGVLTSGQKKWVLPKTISHR